MNFGLALAILALGVSLPWIARIWLHYTITWREAAIVSVTVLFLGLAIFGAGSYSQVHDTQILNGKITEKYRDRVSCSHSYSCNCRTVRSGNSTSTKCDTCYEHMWDYDWVVKSTIGRFEINRIDRQGTKEPPRFTQVVLGEPASRHQGYVNWIKGAPDSIFALRETFANKYPHLEYPEVFDYYRVNRVINRGGISPAEAVELNTKLNNALREVGPKRQMNTVFVFTNHPNRDFSEALRQDWLGGKKNDAIIIWSRDSTGKTQWVRVFSWAKRSIYNVSLEDTYLGMVEFNVDQVVGEFVRESAQFERRSMEEYAYLKHSIEPPKWVVITCFLVSLIVSIGGIVFTHREDLA